MDYEEKYKDALERARNLHKDAIDMDDNIRAKQCEIIFPELKESEDERIRKWLIGYFQRNEVAEVIKTHDILAWLEKQGNVPLVTEKPYNELPQCPHKYNVGDWIVSKYNSIYQVKEVLKGSYNLLCTSNAEEINSISLVDNYSRLLCMKDIQNLIEKQDEQKPFDYENANIQQKDFAPKKVTCTREVKDFNDYIVELSKQFPEVSFAKLSRIAVRVKKWLEKQGEYDDNIITRDDEILQAISVGLTDMVKDFGWSDFGGLPIEEIQKWLEKQSDNVK